METTTGEGGEGGMRRRISSKLDFSPEEEDHERDQNQKLSSSSTYYSESYSLLAQISETGKVVSRKILDNKSMSIFMTLATIWALFGDDVRVFGVSNGVRRDFRWRSDRVDCLVRTGDNNVVLC